MLEKALLDYIERFGLTEKAREYYQRPNTKERNDQDVQDDDDVA